MATLQIEIPDDKIQRTIAALSVRYPKTPEEKDLDYIGNCVSSVLRSFIINKEGSDAGKLAAVTKRTELKLELVDIAPKPEAIEEPVI